MQFGILLLLLLLYVDRRESHLSSSLEVTPSEQSTYQTMPYNNNSYLFSRTGAALHYDSQSAAAVWFRYMAMNGTLSGMAARAIT